MKIITILILIVSSFCLIVFRRFIFNLPKLIYWLIHDIVHDDKETFKEYGCWFFVGKQGSGKTVSLVEQLERLRKRYPKLKIYTNMGYAHETAPLKNLNDLLNVENYNGKFGTVFVIDEIQNEFAASTSQNFPETVLSLITQQRKNRILILTTSQVFTRVQKPLREQCYRAIECKTYLNRYTTCKHYDGIEYAESFDRSDDFKLLHRKRIEYHSFVQTNDLRNLFDSYKLIERLSRDGFVTKIPIGESCVNVSLIQSGKRSARQSGA